ncbi:MAG: mechanosensitive ion channel family protein [Aquificae bacterium]|nr:mechanosensitive ion channel family protein [Aquificota bacterium]
MDWNWNPEWTNLVLNHLRENETLYLYLGSLLLYAYAVLKGSRLLLKVFKKVASLTRTGLDDKFLSAAEGPLKLLLLTVGAWFLSKFFRLEVGWLSHLPRLGLTVALFWFLYNLAQFLKEGALRFARRTGRDNAEHVAEFVVKVVRFAVLFVGLSLLLQQFGINVTALLASLGIGGLAVALAAKDTLSNIFGGITIIADNPFAKGDWVLIDGKYEGIVESIGLRSTRLRTFEESLLTIPNSLVVNSAIENFSRRGVRRVTFHLQLAKDAPVEKVLRLAERLREYLKNDPSVAKHKSILAYLDRVGEHSYDLFLYFFANTADWEKWLALKERWISDFVKMVEEEGLRLAYPVTEVILNKPLPKNNKKVLN